MALACGSLLSDSKLPSVLSSSATPAVAWSPGVLRINGIDHLGSGNVLPGARVETMRSTGQLYLADGTRMRLGVSTSLSVGAEGIQLDYGSARIDSIPAGANRLSISAGELKIKASGGMVQRPNMRELIVTAASVSTEVRKSSGLLIAMVRPGQTLAFSFAASGGREEDTRITGKVANEKGHYFLTDEVTCQKTELQGGNPGAFLGARVQAIGQLVNSAGDDRRTLVVKKLTTPSTVAATTCAAAGSIAAIAVGAAATGGAAAAASGTAATAATGTAAAVGTATAVGTAAAATGISTAMIAGITVASVAGLAASVAVVSQNDSKSISQ